MKAGIEIYDGSAHCRECDPGPSGCPGITADDLDEVAAALGGECRQATNGLTCALLIGHEREWHWDPRGFAWLPEPGPPVLLARP